MTLRPCQIEKVIKFSDYTSGPASFEDQYTRAKASCNGKKVPIVICRGFALASADYVFETQGQCFLLVSMERHRNKCLHDLCNFLYFIESILFQSLYSLTSVVYFWQCTQENRYAALLHNRETTE